jgi:hypothetical protein
MSCNNGCNDIACDGTGMRIMSTLLECGLSIGFDLLQFPQKSAQLPPAVDWEEPARRLQVALRVATRKLKIVGFATPSEGASPAARTRLARQRAEAVARVLVEHGADRGRLSIDVGDPATFGIEGYASGRVYLRLEPNYAEPDDYDPSAPGYEELCWIKYPSTSSPSASPPPKKL